MHKYHKAAALRCNGRWQAASSSDLPQRCVAARGQDFASPFLFPLLFVFNHNRIVKAGQYCHVAPAAPDKCRLRSASKLSDAENCQV